MIPTLVQSVAYNQADAQTSSPSATWPSSTVAGNLVVAMILVDGGVGFGVTPPAGWTLIGDAVYGGVTDISAYMYYIENAASRSGAETFTLSSAVNSVIILAEVSGIALAGSPDVTLDIGGIGTTATTANVTTTNAVDFLIGIIGFFGTTGETAQTSPTNGFSLESQAIASHSTFRWNAAMVRRTVLATGTYSVSTTQNQSVQWVTILASFKAASNAISRRGGFVSQIG